MKAYLTLILAIFFNHILFAQVPVITSFSPASGPVGTTVIITGTNFSPISANNIVYFGAVRAVVNSASAGSLAVTVPAGTTYQPITVTCNNLIAFSDQPFIQTFVSSDTAFTVKSFSTKTGNLADRTAHGIAINDLDLSGFVDVVGASSKNFIVYRSIINGGIHFPLTSIANVAICDITGDGWPDVVTSNNSGTISVTRNGSGSLGFLTLNAPLQFTLGENSPFAVSYNDIDGDGKVYLAATDEVNNKVLIVRNTSSNGVVSFSPVIEYPAGLQPQASQLRDLDGDKKPDLMVSNFNSSKISVYRNISTSGNILFDLPQDINAPAGVGAISISDMDGDGKADIIAAYKTDSSVLIFRNTSVSNTISFDPFQKFLAGTNMNDIAVHDIDGDGKPDIAGISTVSNSVCLLKNKSVTGKLLLESKVEIMTGEDPSSIAIADFDNDGKPDIAVSDFYSEIISFYRNSIGEDNIIELCPPPGNKSLASKITGMNCQWQVDTGNGFVNIQDNSYYSGTATNTINLINIPTSWYGYKYRCVNQLSTSSVFELKFLNAWSGATNSSWENAANWSCSSLPDANTDVVVNSGTIIINSNVTVRSLKVNPGAHLTVNSGFTLNVLH